MRNPEEGERNLFKLRQLVRGALAETRALLFELRPSALAEFGLDVALKSLTQDMSEAAGLSTDYHIDLGERRLPFEVESTLYRIAQESLTNIVRHANAKHIYVELVTLPYAICLRIDDDGIGFVPEEIIKDGDSRRLGLIGMQERVEMLDGLFEVHSGPNAGTSVRVRIPQQLEGSS